MDRIERLKEYGEEQKALEKKKEEQQKDEHQKMLEDVEKYKQQIREWQPRIEKLIETINIALVSEVVNIELLQNIDPTFRFCFFEKDGLKIVYAVGTKVNKLIRAKMITNNRLGFTTDGHYLVFDIPEEAFKSRKRLIEKFVNTFEEVESIVYKAIDSKINIK